MANEMKLVPKSWLTRLADKIRTYTGSGALMNREAMLTGIDTIYNNGGGSGDDSLLHSLLNGSITEFDVPDGITALRSTAFANCTKLVRVSIPESVTSIGSSVFQNVPLVELTIPVNCQRVSGFAYANMPKLESIKLGNTTRISTQGLANNTKCLTYDFTRCTQVPQLDNVDAFNKINAEAKILVPAHLYSDWIEATNWSQYADYIVPVETVDMAKTFTYALNSDGETYAVSGIGNHDEENLILPAYYNGKPVTSILDSSFFQNNTVRNILISNKITEIGNKAFRECANLLSINIPKSVKSLGNSTFAKCTKLENIDISKESEITSIPTACFALTNISSITLPDSIIEIGPQAFQQCTKIENIIIPENVERINDNAFAGCSSLKRINIPSSVSFIGKQAFGGCANLKEVHISNMESWLSVTISDESRLSSPMCNGADLYLNGELVTEVIVPEGFTAIGNQIFLGCKSIEKVTIPETVTDIGYAAFHSCTSLESISIPDSVTKIGERAFQNNNFKSITIGTNVETIDDGAFSFSKNLEEVLISNSVTTIGTGCFKGCTSLKNIVIPDNVTSIGDDIFGNCSSLESVTLSKSLTEIPINMSQNCTSLKNIIINENIIKINSEAFENCTSLTSIVFPSTIETISSLAFTGCSNIVLYDFSNLISLPTLEASNVFHDLEGFEILIPANLYTSCLKDTNWAVYKDCIVAVETSGMEKKFAYTLNTDDTYTVSGIGTHDEDNLIIPEYYDGKLVTSIGSSAFSWCTSLTSIEIPDSVTSIGDFAFRYCTSLTSVVIGDSVTSIGKYAFSGCTSLTSIEIPDSVTNIGDYAFYNCNSISLYDFSACSSIPSLNSSNNIFDTSAEGCRILVPAHLYNDWIEATNWTAYADYIVAAE